MNESKETLFFRIAEGAADWEYILSCGRNAWIAVYGNDYRYNPVFFKNNSSAIMANRPDNVIIASDIHGNKAGICIIDSRITDEKDTAHISLIYLEKQYRGRSLGIQLINYAEDICKKRGCKTMRLYVATSNHNARKFYAKHGYSKYGTQLSIFSGQIVLRKSI